MELIGTSESGVGVGGASKSGIGVAGTAGTIGILYPHTTFTQSQSKKSQT